MTKAKFRLICNGDPRALGIERPDGAWDMAAFRAHIAQCPECQKVAGGFFSDLREALDPTADEETTSLFIRRIRRSVTQQIKAEADLRGRRIADIVEAAYEAWSERRVR